ncbi:MAG: glycine cleavage system protein GcvH [Candidatus Dormibacteria bacterium]
MPDLSEYRFSTSHEWVHRDGDVAVVGISDHAQAELGDVIFVELPEVGSVLAPGDKFGTIESVKAASDLYAPVGGRVAAVNDELANAPERVNADPYGEGWMLRLDDVVGGDELLDEAGYRAIGGS